MPLLPLVLLPQAANVMTAIAMNMNVSFFILERLLLFDVLVIEKVWIPLGYPDLYVSLFDVCYSAGAVAGAALPLLANSTSFFLPLKANTQTRNPAMTKRMMPSTGR